MRRRLPASLLALSAACGGEPPAAPPVASTPAHCQAGQLEIAGGCQPAGITACAEGFVADDGDGCAPVLPPAPCAPGTLAIPGDGACREIAPCGQEPWGQVPLAPNSQRVDDSYAGGGSDGSAARPWTTITQAVDAAEPGAIVAIAAGTYAEDLKLSGKPVVLWGRCPTMVTVVGSASATAAIFVSTGADGSAVRDLAVTGGSFGVAASGSVDLLLSRVWVHDTAARGVVIESTFGPTKLLIADSLVEQASDVGVMAYQASLTIERSAVRGTLAGSGNGRGVVARYGSALAVRDSLIAANHDHGVMIAGTEALIERTVVRDTQPVAGLWGGGIDIHPDDDSHQPAQATVRDTVVGGNRLYGIMVEGSSADFERLVVRDTASQDADGQIGAGLQIQGDEATGQPAAVTIREAVIERNHYAGVALTGATVAITSAIIRDTAPPAASEQYGRGIIAFVAPPDTLGTSLSVNASVLTRNTEAAISGHGARLTIDRSVVRDTWPAPSGTLGRGINVQSIAADKPGELTVTGSLLQGNSNTSVFVEGSTATFTDTVLGSTAPNPADGLYGDALEVVSFPEFPAAQALVQGCTLSTSDRAAVASFGATVSLAATHFECNTIDINGQTNAAGGYAFDDLGDNQCGCDGQSHACQVLSTELEPPQPMAE